MPAPPLAAVPPLAAALVQRGVRFATHSYPVCFCGWPRVWFFLDLQRVDLLGAMQYCVRFAARGYQLAPSLAVVTASFGTAHRVPLRLQEVREAAVSLVERATKRYTSLAPLVLPPLLAALAKLPPGVVSFGCLGFWLHIVSVVLVSNLPPLRAALVPSCGAWGDSI